MSASFPFSKRRALALLAAASAIGFSGCAGLLEKKPPVQPAQSVSLNDFMGDWFVIAARRGSLPRDCQRPIERYLLYPDGQIQTTFLAWQPGSPGRLVVTRSMAAVTDDKSHAVWTIGSGMAASSLVILDTAPDYRYAVTATPDRHRAWILSRTRSMSAADYAAALETLRKNGIHTGHLISFPQPR